MKQIAIFSFLLFFSLACSKGKLNIESRPSQAKVYIDGVYKGNTPLELTLPTGEHEVHLKKDGQGYLEKMILSADATQMIRTGLGNREAPIHLLWDKTFGGSNSDYAVSIVELKDGNLAIAGYTDSYGNGNVDAWVLKLNGEGEKIWDKTFGGESERGLAFSIVELKDGNLAIAGLTYSYGNGNGDAWVLKLNGEGEKIWDKTFGGSNSDYANSIVELKDGNLAIAGHTESYGNGKKDVWVLKLNGEGEKVWDKTFGGSKEDKANSIVELKDGNLAIAGFTYSYGNGKNDVYGNGKRDVWVLKLNGEGEKVWDKTFGGSEGDGANSIVELKDGNLAIAGWTESYGNGKNDVWVLKLNGEGEKVWDKTFGGSKWDGAFSIVELKDGNLAIAGWTGSYGNGKNDVWILKFDSEGEKVWDKTFGGSKRDIAFSIVELKDGNLAIAGYTESYGNGNADVWVFRMKIEEKKDAIYASSSFKKN